ncbi:Na+/H+ antiporter NhaA [Actinocrispum wychmicini]|uniref:Na(+)/H(+) antiporter NhaA n=1 Tax=Actinocrispum wychmicini TaxID=1213861 RepID=A0A4V2S4V4_9PSEU|nr:Na+/H+ antiporter NhaA [Actinocrispum wychmicini]TCO49710.1 Na+/H+ antiporter NhaA [Actinocrispum wychmicini]
MTEADGWSRRTAWARTLPTPLRTFVRTETGSAAVLFAATVAALAWANIAPGTYDGFWDTTVSIRVGDAELSQSVRLWVNSGLMTFFFFVVGLEARREFDMGELRDRRRIALPLLAGVGGMVVPIGIYLAVNAGTPTAHGWGTAMSTDTAFALGMITLVASRSAARLRTFLLTVTVVDDIVALVIIAIAYSGHVSVPPLLVAVGAFVAALGFRYAGVRYGLVYFVLGAVGWVGLLMSGVEPVVIGLAFGMVTFAYPAARGDLERATNLFRLFREQPTPQLAREAQFGVARALSPNERLQQLYHPWTSYLIVPLFALANAGLRIDGEFLARAVTSPVTWGILLGYVLGKPVGVAGVAWLATKLSRGRVRPPIGWAAVAGGGAVAGIGFTVSLLIATLAFTGETLEEAKLGVLTAALCAAVLSWLVFRVTAALPHRLRARLLLGTSESIVDLTPEVDDERDHLRGPANAPVTVVEYGDFECPYCGLAEPVVRELLADFGDVRYVWRHLPLSDVHPRADLAARAAEAAADQDGFWPMHDLLLTRQDALTMDDLLRYGEELGLDVDRFAEHMRRGLGVDRIAEDIDSADLSGVSGTPTFFINGRRHYGAYDIDTLKAAVRTARARAAVLKGK